MTSETGLREDIHLVGGILLKEITGFVQVVIRNQVLQIGVITFSVHTCGTKTIIHQSIVSSNPYLKFYLQNLAIQDHLLGRGK